MVSNYTVQSHPCISVIIAFHNTATNFNHTSYKSTLLIAIYIVWLSCRLLDILHYWCLVFLAGRCAGRTNMGDPQALSIATTGTSIYGPYAARKRPTFFDACWPNSCSAVIGTMVMRRPYPHIKATRQIEWKEDTHYKVIYFSIYIGPSYGYNRTRQAYSNCKVAGCFM